MMRVASLLPSATEIVCALGCADLLVARSHDCDFPPEVADLPAVTTFRLYHEGSSASIDAEVSASLRNGQPLYGLRTDLLAELQPDLIVTQDLCRVCTVTGAEVDAAVGCMPGQVTVVSASPGDLAGVWASILTIGEALGVRPRAERLVNSLEERLQALSARCVQRRTGPPPRVLLLEWLDPPFSSGHWNPELIAAVGAVPAWGHGASMPSRRLSLEEVIHTSPDVVVIACCGMSAARAARDLPMFERRHDARSPGWLRARSVRVADGHQFFSRPGPRLVDSAEWLGGVLSPSVA